MAELCLSISADIRLLNLNLPPFSPTSNTTEALNLGTGAWAKSFDLQSGMDSACTVKISPVELLTIAVEQRWAR